MGRRMMACEWGLKEATQVHMYTSTHPTHTVKERERERERNSKGGEGQDFHSPKLLVIYEIYSPTENSTFTVFSCFACANRSIATSIIYGAGWGEGSELGLQLKIEWGYTQENTHTHTHNFENRQKYNKLMCMHKVVYGSVILSFYH